jgi:hypothetical protein
MGRNKLEINPGDIFKNWKVIKEIEKRGIQRYFSCECLLCNREYNVSLISLQSKNISFCCRSCAYSDDLRGQNFGRLTVISKHSQFKSGAWRYLCICDCGEEKVISGAHLKSGEISSCTCYNKEVLSEIRSGDKHHNWKGGLNSETIADRIKLSTYINPIIKKRDNNTCQNCGQYNVRLDVHHIFDFATYLESRLEIANLITLCFDCHKNFHSIYTNIGTNTLSDLETWMNKEYQYRNELLEIYRK